MESWPAPGVIPIVAHQGGWDEILLVVGPLALIAAALWVANRRVSAQVEAADGTGGDGIDEEHAER
ncbi:MAG: hypothetical protein ACFCVK_05950 [Acidimicrobiales bacterium]